MKTLLGPNGYTELVEYQKTMPVRRFIDSLAATIPPGEPALTVDQADRLAQVALAHDSTYQAGHGTSPNGVNWTEVWGSAAQILSEHQMATLRTMVEIAQLDRKVTDGVNPTLSRTP